MTPASPPFKPLFLYTMTSGLGDYIVLGDLAAKLGQLCPQARALLVHRGNPHVRLWPAQNGCARFYDIHKVREWMDLLKSLRRHRDEKYLVFGIQMAPGSLQGFCFYTLLKRMRLLDFVVDFNLVNADIVTPPRGDYILDLHLNQIAQLLGIPIPAESYRLRLPPGLSPPPGKKARKGKVVGVHPWSRRGDQPGFVWQKEKWLAVIEDLVRRETTAQVVVLGRDDGFQAFSAFLAGNLAEGREKLSFRYCNSVQELVDTVGGLDALISVNTAAVHLGYALDVPMVVLSGPSLDLWSPKSGRIGIVRDRQALFQASDRRVDDDRFGSVARIAVADVMEALQRLTEVINV